MTFRKEVRTRLLIKIEMAMIDPSVEVALFSATVRAVHIAKHTVRSTLLCRQSETRSSTNHGWTRDSDGLEVSKLLGLYVHKQRTICTYVAR